MILFTSFFKKSFSNKRKSSFYNVSIWYVLRWVAPLSRSFFFSLFLKAKAAGVTGARTFSQTE
jgi:hypothetical protein